MKMLENHKKKLTIFTKLRCRQNEENPQMMTKI